MNKYKKITPEGFFDLLYPESYKKFEIEKNIQNIFRSFGYYDVKLPLLEYYDVFENEFLENINTFKLVDKNGQITVLRPDITMPIARLTSSKLSDSQLPIKLSYTDSVFRMNETYGKSREVFQAGIELIGVSNPFADAEIITVAIESIKSTGMEKFQIDIGQIGFFNSLVDDLNFNKSDIELLRELIDKKDLLGVENFLDSIEIDSNKKEILLNLSSYYGNIEVIDNVMKMCSSDKEIKSLEYLKKVFEVLYLRGYEKYISIDLGMLNKPKYYSGIIIRGFTYGIGYPILSGGRYDNLLSRYGKENSAVGFSINVNELITSLNRQNIYFDVPHTKILIVSNEGVEKEAYQIAKQIREEKNIVEEELSGLKHEEIRGYILKRNIQKAIYIDKEIITLIDLSEKDDKEFSPDEFYVYMEERKWSI